MGDLWERQWTCFFVERVPIHYQRHHWLLPGRQPIHTDRLVRWHQSVWLHIGAMGTYPHVILSETLFHSQSHSLLWQGHRQDHVVETDTVTRPFPWRDTDKKIWWTYILVYTVYKTWFYQLNSMMVSYVGWVLIFMTVETRLTEELMCCLLWIDKARPKDKTYISVK